MSVHSSARAEARHGQSPAARRGDGRIPGRLRAAGLKAVHGLSGRGRPGSGLRARGARGDRGQAAVEFVGVMPVLLATAVLLWEAALVGYTFSLAGNAADEAVRAGAVADGSRTAACRQAAREHLPSAWRLGDVSCATSSSGEEVRADLTLDLPLLFPGVNIPISVPAHASAVRES
ncbi:TadE family protein [Streptomyces corynorhini]|uniref:Pilus assembly protein n=1 Tax=Streptomyces corynorhini TaxID=2282652 RepID=A0A370B1D5_9ACTN|nr:TadE family protein [Streptomyces corynorhini]RDG35401.1 pilus assembly protein [Streptomyces corynorhini]